MKAIDCIKNRNYFLSQGGDVVCNFKIGSVVGSMTLDLSSDHQLIQSIKLTQEMIYDAAYATKSAFSSKYKDLLIDKSIPIQECYLRIRDWIVDEAIPLKKRLKKQKIASKKSRKDQVADLLNEGITKPSQIAAILNSHPSYISGIIKKINAGNN